MAAYTTYSFPVTKAEKTSDGDFHVLGKASDGGIDHDRQVVSPQWMARAIQDWLRTGGNVRVAHNPGLYPAGKGVEAWTDSSGATWVRSLIVEDTAKKLVKKSVLTAYSVGISRPDVDYSNKSVPGGTIVGGELVELSLVDRPSNARCGIEICKSVGGVPRYVGKGFKLKEPSQSVMKSALEAAEAALIEAELNSSNPQIRIWAEMARHGERYEQG